MALPFEELFSPLVLTAREELQNRSNSGAYNLLTQDAHAGWERYLLERLTTAAAGAAQWQFQLFKTVRSAFPLTSGASNGVDSHYRAFIGEDPAERLRHLIVEFPALSSLCAMLVENWLSTVLEFLVRLNADRAGLPEQFGGSRYAFPVAGIQAGLSDPHLGGRCVVRLHFTNGSRLIYKPRSLAPEVHFSKLLDRLNATDIPHKLRSLQCCDRGRHGWMENVDLVPCKSIADVHAFYWRAGVLMGAVYLARGVDIHRENLIAAGESPVLVDLEALWHSQSVGSQQRSSASNDSLIRTGFLPVPSVARGATYQWGGLSRTLEAKGRSPIWACINQHGVALEKGWSEASDHPNLPEVGGVKYLANEFLPAIEGGYRWLGERLLGDEDGNAFLRQWLQGLRRCTRRLILEPTARYKTALDQLTTPHTLRKLRNDRDLAVQIEQRAWIPSPEELTALKQMDVPYFLQTAHCTTASNDNDLPPSLVQYAEQGFLIADSLTCAGSP